MVLMALSLVWHDVLDLGGTSSNQGLETGS